MGCGGVIAWLSNEAHHLRSWRLALTYEKITEAHRHEENECERMCAWGVCVWWWDVRLSRGSYEVLDRESSLYYCHV